MKKCVFLFALTAVFAYLPAATLAGVFQSHMVLQRGVPVKIWGQALAFEKIEITLGSAVVKIKADSDGNFEAVLPAVETGSAMTLTLKAKSGNVICDDVVAGDVWLLCGDSNLEISLSQSSNSNTQSFQTEITNLRLFTPAKNSSRQKQSSLSGEWKVCTSVTAADFSAIGFHFGRVLTSNLNVPIGLIDASWSGSMIESWIDEKVLAEEKEFSYYIDARELVYADYDPIRYSRELDVWMTKLSNSAKDKTHLSNALAERNYNDLRWKSMNVPGTIESAGLNIDGVIWFRKTFMLPRPWLGSAATLFLSPVSDWDQTYVNGKPVGETLADAGDALKQVRVYNVPANALVPGINVITVRVFNSYSAGGITGKSDDLFITSRKSIKSRVPLKGQWKYWIELEQPASNHPARFKPQNDMELASMAFNSQIAPLADFKIKGVLWSQGDGNAKRAEQYRRLLPMLIQSWRKHFENDQLAFLITGSPGQKAAWDKTGLAYAELREAQREAAMMPDTALVNLLDLGSGSDELIWQRQDEAGRRSAMTALSYFYSKETAGSSPVMVNVRYRLETGITEFNFADGLTTSGGAVRGFEIAGPDGKYYSARARIIGNTVEAQSDFVVEPRYLRYAWKNYTEANLINAAGFAAQPFRTDKYKWVTEGNK